MNEQVRERAIRWLAGWQQAGAALEDERQRRLRGMTAEEASALTRDLLGLWRPSDVDECGAELVTHQRWFAAAARASRVR